MKSIYFLAWSKGWSNTNLSITPNEFINNFNWFDAWKSVHGKVFINKVLIYLLISSLFFIPMIGKKMQILIMIKKDFHNFSKCNGNIFLFN